MKEDIDRQEVSRRLKKKKKQQSVLSGEEEEESVSVFWRRRRRSSQCFLEEKKNYQSVFSGAGGGRSHCGVLPNGEGERSTWNWPKNKNITLSSKQKMSSLLVSLIGSPAVLVLSTNMCHLYWIKGMWTRGQLLRHSLTINQHCLHIEYIRSINEIMTARRKTTRTMRWVMGASQLAEKVCTCVSCRQDVRISVENIRQIQQSSLRHGWMVTHTQTHTHTHDSWWISNTDDRWRRYVMMCKYEEKKMT